MDKKKLVKPAKPAAKPVKPVVVKPNKPSKPVKPVKHSKPVKVVKPVVKQAKPVVTEKEVSNLQYCRKLKKIITDIRNKDIRYASAPVRFGWEL
jgi:outer membrane biosynthesis protein TonB